MATSYNEQAVCKWVERTAEQYKQKFRATKREFTTLCAEQMTGSSPIVFPYREQIEEIMTLEKEGNSIIETTDKESLHDKAMRKKESLMEEARRGKRPRQSVEPLVAEFTRGNDLVQSLLQLQREALVFQKDRAKARDEKRYKS